MIKEYVIEAPNSSPFLVLPISTLFAFGCGCHTNLFGCPPYLLKAGSVTAVPGRRDPTFLACTSALLVGVLHYGYFRVLRDNAR